MKKPKGLGPHGRALWKQLQDEYSIVDAGGLALLRVACECEDLERQCMATAQKDGLASVDRYGQRRPHPLLAAARDARAQKLSALKSLHLDVEPLNARPGRPAAR